MQFLRFICTSSDFLNKCIEYWLVFTAAAMVIVVGIQVFFRYVLNDSLFWSEELGRLILVQLSFFGATVAYKRGAHLGTGFLVERLPSALQKAVEAFVLCVSLFFFGALAVYGFRFFDFIRFQTTTTLMVSKQVPFAPIPISGLILFLHTLAFLILLFLNPEYPGTRDEQK